MYFIAMILLYISINHPSTPARKSFGQHQQGISGDQRVAGSKGYGFTGIWPAYSLLHHSCVPNANVMVLGDTLVVRAAKRLKVNTLIRVTKIGDSVLMPLQERHAKLAVRRAGGGLCCESPSWR